MSKLDELDKELVDGIADHFPECKNACCHLQVRTMEKIMPIARKYYDLGKLEEREALKKMVEKNCRYFCKGKTTKQLPVCPHANLLNELNK